MKVLKKFTVPLLCGFATFLLFNYVFFIGYVPSVSMEPTIKAGSFVFGHRFTGNIQRGDVVVFRRYDTYLVKRVAGIPGDVIRIADEPPVCSCRELLVPNMRFYLLGDNSSQSLDSRFWENPFVEGSEIIATLSLKQQ